MDHINPSQAATRNLILTVPAWSHDHGFSSHPDAYPRRCPNPMAAPWPGFTKAPILAPELRSKGGNTKRVTTGYHRGATHRDSRSDKPLPRRATDPSVRRQIPDVTPIDPSPLRHGRHTSYPTKLQGRCSMVWRQRSCCIGGDNSPSRYGGSSFPPSLMVASGAVLGEEAKGLGLIDAGGRVAGSVVATAESTLLR
jgi:hypothetical protein